jgi:hypothetical protein
MFSYRTWSRLVISLFCASFSLPVCIFHKLLFHVFLFVYFLLFNLKSFVLLLLIYISLSPYYSINLLDLYPILSVFFCFFFSTSISHSTSLLYLSFQLLHFLCLLPLLSSLRISSWSSIALLSTFVPLSSSSISLSLMSIPV